MPQWTLAQARAHVLTRQGLVDPFESELVAVRAMIAVQTQYAQSLPVAVAARTRCPRPGWDDVALGIDGHLIKSWSLRCTLHTHHPDDHALILGVFGPDYERKYSRWMSERRGLDARVIEDRVEASLAGGPLSRSELHKLAPELAAIPMVGWGVDVMGLAYRRRLKIIGRGADQKFALIEPSEEPRRMEDLAHRYFEAFGPATIHDFAHWTGRTLRAVKPAVDAIRDRLIAVHIDGLAGERFTTLPHIEECSPPLRLLAKFDPLILAHREKSFFIPAPMTKHVFRAAGQVEATVLIDGEVVGTWRLKSSAQKVTIEVEAWKALRKREITALERESHRLAKALGKSSAGVVLTGLS